MLPLILAAVGLSFLAVNPHKVNTEELRARAERLQSLLPVFRVIFGWTANDLGQRLDLSKQAISNIETGKTKLSVAQYLAIKYLFIDYLYNIGNLDSYENNKHIPNKLDKSNVSENGSPFENLQTLFPSIFNALVDHPTRYLPEELEGIKKRVISIAKSKQINMSDEDIEMFYNALAKELVNEDLETYKKQVKSDAIQQIQNTIKPNTEPVDKSITGVSSSVATLMKSINNEEKP